MVSSNGTQTKDEVTAQDLANAHVSKNSALSSPDRDDARVMRKSNFTVLLERASTPVLEEIANRSEYERMVGLRDAVQRELRRPHRNAGGDGFASRVGSQDNQSYAGKQ